MIEQTIEIDCPPGDPRPGDILAEVLKGTGLSPREPVSKVFGNWTWDYCDVPAEVWNAVRPLLKERIIAYHKAGVIRYGSW